MRSLSLTDHIWKNMKSLQFNAELLRKFTLQTHKETKEKFKSAFKNLKKRKQYNKRIMNPIICKLQKDLDEFLDTAECKDYFKNCTLISSINTEEVEREIFKSSVRAAAYKSKTQGIKRQRLNYDDEKEEEEEDEEEEEEEEEQEEYGEPSSSRQQSSLSRQQPQQRNDVEDSTLAEEHLKALMDSLDPDESFDSVMDQDNNYSVFNYLGGDGAILWNPKHTNSLNVSKLMKFRDINITGAQNFKILNDIRVLSLSFIFVYGHTSTNTPRLCEYLDIKDCSSLCQQVDIPSIENVPAVTTELLGLQRAYFTNIHNLDNFNYTCIHTTGLAQVIITNIYKSLLVWNESSSITENQFSEQAVFSILLPLFDTCRNYEISKYDKTMVAMNDYKPDLLHNHSGNKYESDFVKTQREMKAIIDSQVEIGVDEPQCYGLLVDGYDWYLYKMTLEFDGEYNSKLVTQFRTLRDAQDIMLLLPAINALAYLNEELNRIKLNILDTKRNKQGRSIKAEFRRPSFTKPIKRT